MNEFSEFGSSREIGNIPADSVRVSFFVPVPLAGLYERKISRHLGEDSLPYNIIGTSYFRPLPGSHPHSGEIGKLSQIEEALVSFTCPSRAINGVANLLEQDHPHETFVAEIESKDPTNVSSLRVRAHVPESILFESIAEFAKAGIGVIGNYDMCFFAYPLENGMVSIETILTNEKRHTAAAVAEELGIQCFFDPLKEGIELQGKGR